MGNSSIALYTGSTTPLVPMDAESVTVAAVAVVRERMQLAGAADTEIARVQGTAPSAGTEMGLVVRVAGPLQAGSAALGTVGITSLVPGTAATSLGKAVASGGGATDTGVALLALRTDALATLTPADGQYARLMVDSIGAQWVTLSHMPQVVGSVAHDSPDTQPPVKVGGRASTALRAAVAADDRVDALWDADGALVTRKTAHANIVNGNASNTDGTSTPVIAAAGAGIRTYVTDIALTNAHATAFAYVEIKDGTTVVQTLPAPASSGGIFHFDPPLRGTANTAWNFDPSAATTTLICSMHGYTSLT